MDKDSTGALLLRHLPEFFTDYREFRELAKAVERHLVGLSEQLQECVNDQYIVDAGDRGLKRYEGMLQILKKPTSTLDERRYDVQLAWNEQAPFTITTLKKTLADLCGADGYTVQAIAPYTYRIMLSLKAMHYLPSVREMLIRILPANILCTVDVQYNTYGMMAQFTHAEMAAYTHGALPSTYFEKQ